MDKSYVEKIDESYWISGTRVSLDSIVHAFLDGHTAESIAQSFPVLSLEQVYGSILFYLTNRAEINKYLEKTKGDFEKMRKKSHENDPMFYQKLANARTQVKVSS